MRRVASVLFALAVVAACSGDEVTSTPPTASMPTATTAASSIPDEADVPATTAPLPAATTEPSAPTPTTAPVTTAVPEATVAPTVPAPSTVAPTSDVTHVYVASWTDGGGSWQRLGVWDGSAWVDLAQDAVYSDPTAPLVEISSVDLAGGLSGGYTLEPWGCIDTDVHNGITPGFPVPALAEDPGGVFRQQAIAVTAGWPLQPRAIAEIGVDADVYQATAEALLAGSGIDPSLGDVVQVFRVDLDGNGTEEVLVSFERLTPPFGADGDISLVYARVVAGAAVNDIELEQYVVLPPAPGDPEFPRIGGFRIAAIADLNGDARMEVVVASSGWEFTGTTVYEFDGTGFTPVLTGGCGF